MVLLLLVPLPGRGQEADTLSYLPLPDVPSSLRTPVTRADHIVSRFWDALDFSTDMLKTRDRDFMERNLANYLSLFPIADSAVLVSAVDTLVTRAGKDAPSLSVLVELAGKYLCEPESPVYSEEYYGIFLDAFLRAPVHEYERMRLAAQRELMQKNRPGTPRRLHLRDAGRRTGADARDRKGEAAPAAVLRTGLRSLHGGDGGAEGDGKPARDGRTWRVGSAGGIPRL